MSYLEGELIDPRELKKHIGRRIEYLRQRDIDLSGRGYFFPRYATIAGVHKRCIVTEGQEYLSINDFKEVKLLPE